MNKIIVATLLCFFTLTSFFAIAEDEHKPGERHSEAEESKPGKEGAEEGGSQVGSDKGILEANEASGIKLASSAEKNFEIKRIKVPANGVVEIPKKAIVTAVSEVNIVRYRNGFYKRVDFEEIKRTPTTVTIRSNDLKSTDEVVVQGLGFLRVAEISAFGGESEGHGH